MVLGIFLMLGAVFDDTGDRTGSSAWVSSLSDDGDPVHWHSCTVDYAVDLNGYPAEERDAIDEAIESTEEASGVDFVEVPQADADLMIILSKQRQGQKLATTQPYLLEDEYTSASVIVYAKAFQYPYPDRVDNYRHEFGHVLGLDHIEGSDLMNAFTVNNPTDDGWRTGLQALYPSC